MTKHGMEYPVAIDTKGVVSRGYPSNGIPNATVVGSNGKVLWKGHPMSMDKHLEAAVSGAKMRVPTVESRAGAAAARDKSD
jgi:hypothetical protein